MARLLAATLTGLQLCCHSRRFSRGTAAWLANALAGHRLSLRSFNKQKLRGQSVLNFVAAIIRFESPTLAMPVYNSVPPKCVQWIGAIYGSAEATVHVTF